VDYAPFVAARRAAWQAADAEIGGLGPLGIRRLDFAALEAFVARHRALSAELGVVQARWPGSEAEATLRRLVLRGHGAITPPAPTLTRRVWRFFTTEYPAEFRACLPSVQLAGLVFLAGVWLGFVLTTANDAIAAVMVGPDALAMIRRGQIWTDDLGDTSPVLLAIQIFVNNIAVALLAWAGGLLLGLGTTLALLRNGAMVGSVLAVCLRYGIADRLLAFIPAHGMLELFLIVVAGAAGFELTGAALGDGEGAFGARFAAAGARSFRLVAGTLPWFVVLGIVEGFLSPQMGFPTEAKLAVGALVLTLFLLYTRLPARTNPR
jgi:uncharacterized membrane protein SpoIIM required for sporulation